MQHKLPLALLTAAFAMPLLQPSMAFADHHEEKAENKNQNDQPETLQRMRQRRADEQSQRSERTNRDRQAAPSSTHPILAALDRDGDGTLSEDEIRVAAASLKKLDKNNDGKLTTQEITARSGGQRGAMAAEADSSTPQRINRGGNPAARLKQLDKNNDGKLSKDEIPDRAWERLSRADLNKDGELDASELKAVAERMGQGMRGSGEERQKMEERMERNKTESTEPVQPKRPPTE